MKLSDRTIPADFKRIESEQDDYQKAELRLLAGMMFQIFLIREFEQLLLKLHAEGCVHGPVHTSIGQEAIAAGAVAPLRPVDQIASTHRAHHHYLAKAIGFHMARENGPDVLNEEIPPIIQEEVTRLLGEVMGLSIGCCGGRGGSMHLRNAAVGVLGTNAIVAGGIPPATGAAWACKYTRNGGVVVCFLGDGAVNQGAFHEALNLAGLWRLPIIYVIENNLYAVATPVEKATATEDLAVKAAAYNIRGRIVDGMDPVAVMLAVREAREHATLGRGPTVIEAKCYRFLHHAGPMPGSAFNYRLKDEEDRWRSKDPYDEFPRQLTAAGVLSAGQVELLREKARKIIEHGARVCTHLRDGKHVVNDELWPKPESLTVGLRSDGSEWKGVVGRELDDFTEHEEITYVQAITAVTGRHLEKDDRVLVFGEEVANFGGGAYQATKGLPARFPDRVINTPISECGFTGLGAGLAMSGLRPVVEIMFPDFALVAADQLFNQIGKLRHMYGNSTDMPIVVRTRVAIGCGYGGQHSMDPVGLFALFGGWRIVAPATPFDYIGLFNSAMLSRDPVLILEHHALYPIRGLVPKGNLDYYIPFGKARIAAPGDRVTVLCYSSMVGLAEQAARELADENIDVEVIDLRTLSLADLDYETIGRSLKKTHTMVILEQAAAGQSIGSRIAGECQRRFFDDLDGPIVTVAGADVPNPVSRKMEAVAIPDLERVKETLCRAAKKQF